MKIEQNEIELNGKWEWRDGHMEGDAIEKRITWLVMNVLKQVAFTGGGHEILYEDPVDGRYWERTFPHPQGQGVGPQKLRVLERQEAANKYNLTLDQL